MTSPAKSPAGLRPFLPADTALLAEIFRASIAELTNDDYTEAQQAAWMASAGDETAFGARLAGELTLVATVDGAPVGAELLENSMILGDNAYEVVPGWLAYPIGSFEEFVSSPERAKARSGSNFPADEPRTEEDLLARYLFKNL